MARESRLKRLRRDVAWVTAGLLGARPKPFAVTTPPVRALGQPRPVRVVDVVREDDHVRLVLEDVRGGDRYPFAFTPGQFLTVLVTIDGTVHRRAYSICSDARHPRTVEVGVKRAGVVSGYLMDHVKVGDELRILGPSGNFGALSSIVPRRLVMIAGGSGITPMMSIARTLLAREAGTRIALIYGNRAPGEGMFLREIAALASDRFVVRHVHGLLDRAAAARELEEVGAAPGDEHLVCGPEGMMEEVRLALTARGVTRIVEERFTAAPRARATGTGGRVVVRGPNLLREVNVGASQTLLEAALAAGIDMPFSCGMGGCGACKLRVVDGALDQDEPSCLTDEERVRGLALSCVGRPRGAVTVEIP